MQRMAPYQQDFLRFLSNNPFRKEPVALYEPVDYIMQLGGKRLRPAVLLAACHLFTEDYHKALPAAMAVEVFHNFSLVHDDIMDAAPLRRGKATVHQKWNVNTGILSGDVMLIEAYRYLQKVDNDSLLPELLAIFNQTAIEVCEGQQYDIDFETRSDVRIEEYLKMIELKTAVLFAGALKMGALIGGASSADADRLYDFGRYLGVAFQLQDDLLDTFGDPEKFGKKVGGDIALNKKTFLYLKALEVADPQGRATLRDWYADRDMDEEEKIAGVRKLFEALGIPAHTRRLIDEYQDSAFHHLRSVAIPEERKSALVDLADLLGGREQ
jgi:geranylgeranyl diphosphate synthase type II